MGLKDFFKPKSKKEGRKELLIPEAPRSKEELPTFPTPEEIPEIRKEVVKEKRGFSVLEKAESMAVNEQQEELDERDELKLKKPIFVYLDSYKEMMNELTVVQNTLKEGADSLVRVAEFKEDQDKEFNKWDAQLKDVQRKLTYVDRRLFK